MPLMHKDYSREDIEGMCSIIAETRNAALAHGDMYNSVMLSHLHKLLYDAYLGGDDGSVTMVIEAKTVEGDGIPATEITSKGIVETPVDNVVRIAPRGAYKTTRMLGGEEDESL